MATRRRTNSAISSGLAAPTETPPPPPRKRRRGREGGTRGLLVTLAAFFVHAITTGFLKSMGVFFVTWQEAFHEGAAAVGWTTSGAVFCLLVFGPLAAFAVKHFGCRVVVMTGGFVACGTVVLASRATSLGQLIGGMVLTGIALSFTYQPSIVIISFYFKKKLGMAMGASFSGVGVGIFGFPPLMRLLIDKYGWHDAMLVLAAIVANISVVGALYRPSALEKAQLKRRKLCGGCCRRAENAQTGFDEIPQEPVTSVELVALVAVNASDRNHQVPQAAIMEDNITVNGKTSVDVACPVFEEDQEEGAAVDVACPIFEEEEGTSADVACPVFEEDEEEEDKDSGLMTRKPDHIQDLDNPSTHVSRGEPSVVRRGCLSILGYLGNIFNLGVFLTNFRYAALCIVACLHGLGYYAALVYTVSRAVSIDIPKFEAALLTSIIGAGSFVGRISHGILIDKKVISPPRFLALAFFIESASCLLLPLTKSFSSMSAFAVFFGVSSGISNSLFPVNVQRVVTVAKAGSSIGLYLLFLGFGNMLGVLIVGGLYDITGSYDASYYAAGAINFVNFVIMSCEPLFKILQVKFDARRGRQDAGEEPQDEENMDAGVDV